MLIAGVFLIAIVTILVGLWYWYRQRKRLEEVEQGENKDDKTGQKENERKEEDNKEKEQKDDDKTKYTRIVYVGSLKISPETNSSGVMV